MLKKILLAIVGLIAVLLIAAIFVDGKFQYEKSISINAPLEKVWMNTSSLEAMDRWSPWNEYDPNMEKTFTGTMGSPGSQQCWEGNEDVGKGCQTIISIQPPKAIETELLFKEPFESRSNAYVHLTPEGNGTKATWGFAGETPYPWRLMNVFMNMEKLMDKDYSKGLSNLKKLSEQ